jgi:hypothetical protein
MAGLAMGAVGRMALGLYMGLVVPGWPRPGWAAGGGVMLRSIGRSKVRDPRDPILLLLPALAQASADREKAIKAISRPAKN